LCCYRCGLCGHISRTCRRGVRRGGAPPAHRHPLTDIFHNDGLGLSAETRTGKPESSKELSKMGIIYKC
jgi:hypothetical protein